jgi:DNA-binding beta-propeller fold protein YncE
MLAAHAARAARRGCRSLTLDIAPSLTNGPSAQAEGRRARKLGTMPEPASDRPLVRLSSWEQLGLQRSRCREGDVKTLNRLTPAATAVLALFLGGSGALADETPLTPVSTTPLPAVTGGDFDHFAVDLARDRLFVPAEVYASIEVFELQSGKHLSSARGVAKSPHKLELIPDKNQLLVADAADASCKILDAKDLHLIKRIPLEPGPDSGVYDPRTRIFYVGNGGRLAKSDFSYISMISVDRQEAIGRIRVEANTLKTMIIDPKTDRLYVNMRDKKQIGVVDLKAKAVVQTWTAPDLNLNSAMAFDGEHHRLFVGSRNPGKLYVLDSDTGKLVTVLDTVNISDDMTLDLPHHRLYVSGADGVDVISQDDPDHYRSLQRVDTHGGKTSVYAPSLKKFYVVHTKGDQAREAGLQIFRVN